MRKFKITVSLTFDKHVFLDQDHSFITSCFGLRVHFFIVLYGVSIYLFVFFEEYWFVSGDNHRVIML